VEFRLLGGIEAHGRGQLVGVGHARRQCVLAVLLVEANAAVSVAELIDRVRAAHPRRRSRENLRSCLTRLRGILAGDDADIVRRGNSYQLAVDESQIDLHRFRQLIDAARIAPDNEAVVLSEEALGLWRGEPFAGLDTPWLLGVRATLGKQLDAEPGAEPAPALRELHHQILANTNNAASFLQRPENVRAELRSRQQAIAARQTAVVRYQAHHRDTDSARVQRQLASLEHNNPAPGPRQPTPASA
jgi:DNA-binding SARP family transcriptional activator